MFVFASSKVTTTCFFSYCTSIFETPDTFSSAFFTVIGQAAQVMPETFKVTVLGDAQAGAVSTSTATTATSMAFRFFMMNSFLLRDLVENLDHIRKHHRNHNKHTNCNEEGLVDATCPRHCTHLARIASLRWSKDMPSSKEQSYKSTSNEKRTVRFEPREIADPCAAQAQRDQNQRPEAARRSQNGGQASHKKPRQIPAARGLLRAADNHCVCF